MRQTPRCKTLLEPYDAGAGSKERERKKWDKIVKEGKRRPCCSRGFEFRFRLEFLRFSTVFGAKIRATAVCSSKGSQE